MMNRLLLLGLNHTTAPLAVREKLVFNAAQQRSAIEALRRQFNNCEIVLLSTCNRVELYIAAGGQEQPNISPAAEELIDFLARFHSVSADAFVSHLYQKAGRGVVEHLFAVASSLDSMVLGETQILGQVRQAYDLAQQFSAAGPLLNPLFQRAIAVGKQVMHQTSLGDGRLSIASVAIDYARRIFDHFNDKTVLCIGAGKMASLVMRNFTGLSPGRLLICNRDPAKATTLAQTFGGQAVAFEQLDDHLVMADIVVSSTGSARPIITKKQFQNLRRKRRYRPIFLIDIALPRDVEAEVGQLENVYLYNLDDLQQVVAGTQEKRTDALDAARRIVAQQVDEFVRWHRTRELGPMIDQLYSRYHRLAREELSRTLNKFPNITDAEKEHLEELTRRIVNKLLHDPIQTLRQSDGPHGSTNQYLHALEKLFQLTGDSAGHPSDEESST